MVFAGRHEPRKGLHVLLRAWPRIRRATGARLSVAGADPLAVRLLLARLRVSDDGIDVLGLLSQEDLTAALLSAKVLVAPSLRGESFGMVLTRAFACATPVVASDIPGYRDVMSPEVGVLTPPNDDGGPGRRRLRPSRRRAAAAGSRRRRSAGGAGALLLGQRRGTSHRDLRTGIRPHADTRSG